MTNSAAVIVNYNDSERISKLVDILQSYKILRKIIISDNSSSDSERKIIDKIKNDVVEIIYNDENLGFSGANNVALNYLDKYNINHVFTINSDVIVSKETMLQSIKFLEEHNDISLVSAEMNEYGEKKQCFYNFPTITRCVCENLGFIKLFNVKPKVIKKCNGYYLCDYIRSSYWCVNYNDFKEIGFFDTNTFLYHVETCVGIKFKKNNKYCAILENMSYEHNHIYKDGYKMRGYRDSYKSLIYIFEKYYNKNKFQMFMLKISYSLGLLIRKICRIK